jgi:hypothetical protein
MGPENSLITRKPTQIAMWAFAVAEVGKKSPTAQDGRAMGRYSFQEVLKKVFFGSTCHSRPFIYLQAVCHNNPSMVLNVSDSSRKTYVRICKNGRPIPREQTVQRHNLRSTILPLKIAMAKKAAPGANLQGPLTAGPVNSQVV